MLRQVVLAVENSNVFSAFDWLGQRRAALSHTLARQSPFKALARRSGVIRRTLGLGASR